VRKSLTKKIRFEVFKRDCFTCKYCGSKAPEVVLVIDHIEPVSKGGTNDFLNLITACESCNAGKSDRRLSDTTIVQKRQEQLEQLQERKEQLEMMMNWQKELLSLDDTKLDEAAEYWRKLAEPFSLNEQGRANLGKLLRKYELHDVLDSMRRALDKCIEHKEGLPTQASVEKAWKYVGRIANMKKVDQEKPHIKDLLYIRGILRNRFSYCDEQRELEILEDAFDAGAKIEDLQKIAKRSNSWSSWQDDMDEYLASV